MSALRRIPEPIRVLLVLGAVYLFLKFGIDPPLPSSLVMMYMLLMAIGAAIYLTLFSNIQESIVGPIVHFLGGGIPGAASRYGRWVVLAGLPLLIWGWSYRNMTKAVEAPLEPRVIHPSPPAEFMGLYNPFRVEGDEEAEREHIEEGKRVYFENCIFCHGDILDGKGIFADRLDPPPANFQDVGTIAMLQESYVYWRVSTGGPGLPQESTPWSSAMPRWETMLSEDERWKVILFLYDYTGHHPRTWE